MSRETGAARAFSVNVSLSRHVAPCSWSFGPSGHSFCSWFSTSLCLDVRQGVAGFLRSRMQLFLSFLLLRRLVICRRYSISSSEGGSYPSLSRRVPWCNWSLISNQSFIWSFSVSFSEPETLSSWSLVFADPFCSLFFSSHLFFSRVV